MPESARMEGVKKEVVAGIADITGYTKFMNISKETVHHSQGIINDLTDCIAGSINHPFVINKIEGDGVFFYALKSDIKEGDAERMSANISDIFNKFITALVRHSQINFCECEACKNVGDLSLKIVLHAGDAFFYKIANHFDELGSLEIVVLHRLLKNSIKADNYLLVTDDAYKELSFQESIHFEDHIETEEIVGDVECKLYIPDIPTEMLQKIAAKAKKR